jgi:hypothetical protein
VVKTCGEVQDLLVRNLLILLTFMVIKRSGGGAGIRTINFYAPSKCVILIFPHKTPHKKKCVSLFLLV